MKSYYIILIGLSTTLLSGIPIVECLMGEGLFLKPSNFPKPHYDFTKNKLTVRGFELGRRLFYDPILSADESVSCGSCHIQSAAFSHHGHDLSHGIHDLLGKRNSPALQNLAWSEHFMWDGGVFDLDLQPIAPITNPVEMDESIQHVVEKLNSDTSYQNQFRQAFGEKEITTALLMRSLSQFMLSLVSANSKYDKVMRKENIYFTDEEEHGYELVKIKCGKCHVEPIFDGKDFKNNGLPPSAADDKGRYDISLNEMDAYTFKIPSLRNLGFTSPYMHDGRFKTIDQVLDHYSFGMVAYTRPDSLLIHSKGIGIPISSVERRQIKAFLQTLNDSSFVSDPRFAEQ